MTKYRAIWVLLLILVLVAGGMTWWRSAAHNATSLLGLPVATSTETGATSTPGYPDYSTCGGCYGLFANGQTIALTPTSRITLTLPDTYKKNALTITPAGRFGETFGASAPAGGRARTFEAANVGTSTFYVPAVSTANPPFTLHVLTLDEKHAWESGMTVVQKTDANQTIHIPRGRKFVVSFGGGLSWKVSFDKKGVVTEVAAPYAGNDVQGVFEATNVGTTTLNAIGAPVCKPGLMCAQFFITIPVYISVERL